MAKADIIVENLTSFYVNGTTKIDVPPGEYSFSQLQNACGSKEHMERFVEVQTSVLEPYPGEKKRGNFTKKTVFTAEQWAEKGKAKSGTGGNAGTGKRK
jgi:hypothetical protein